MKNICLLNNQPTGLGIVNDDDDDDDSNPFLDTFHRNLHIILLPSSGD